LMMIQPQGQGQSLHQTTKGNLACNIKATSRQ
jgi:hypothetical protein